MIIEARTLKKSKREDLIRLVKWLKIEGMDDKSIDELALELVGRINHPIMPFPFH
jgi:hypothetical protein